MNIMSHLPLLVMVLVCITSCDGLGIQASSSIDMPYAYALVAMNLSQFSTVDDNFFGIHLTGWEDTEVEIWMASTDFSQCVTLTPDNLWNWRNQYELSDPSMVDAVYNGFRIRSSRPVNVMATRYSHYQQTLTSYKAFPLTSVSTSFFISPYLRKYRSKPGRTIYWILSGDTETEFRVFKYNDTNIPYLIESGTLRPHHIFMFESPKTVTDYLVGVEINTTAPVAVYSGNNKTYISYDHPQYVPVIQQMPPREDVQSFYIVGPIQSEGASNVFSMFVVFTQENTEAEIRFSTSQVVSVVRSSHGCSCSSSIGRCTISCSNPITKGAYIEVRTTYPQYPVIVECSKPCLVSILKHSMSISYQRYSGYMSLVATPVILEKPVNFFIPIINDEQNPVQRGYVNVVTKIDKLSCLTIDGKPFVGLLENDMVEVSDVEEWTSVVMQVAPGSHTVMCDDSAAPVAVHVHGQSIRTACSTCYSNSYGFSPSYSVRSRTTTTTTATPPTEPESMSPTAHTTTTPHGLGKKQITAVDVATVALVAVTLLAVLVGITLSLIRMRHMTSHPILDPTRDVNTYAPESVKGKGAGAQAQEHVYINNVPVNAMAQESKADAAQETYECLNVPPKKHLKPNLKAVKQSEPTVYEDITQY